MNAILLRMNEILTPTNDLWNEIMFCWFVQIN